MNQYQLIALDMDGTLLNSKKEISPGCKTAIEKALAAGKDVVLSTGRCRPELTEFRELIPGLRYVNCTSGAMVYDFQEQRVIYSNTMDIPTVKEIFLLARKEEAMLHILDEKSIEQTNQLAHIERYGMGATRSCMPGLWSPMTICMASTWPIHFRWRKSICIIRVWNPGRGPKSGFRLWRFRWKW